MTSNIATAPDQDLRALGPGFADPVHGAQRSFRAVLEALSRPGRVQTLPARDLAGDPAPGLSVAATAVLLTLLDAEVRLWLSDALHTSGAASFLRFHTGAQLIDDMGRADFVVMHAAEAAPDLWHRLNLGSDAAPQDGATLLLDGAGLGLATGSTPGWVLRGPGIAHAQPLSASALEPDFWHVRAALAPAYPRGAELMLCDGTALAALPRTTHVSQEH